MRRGAGRSWLFPALAVVTIVGATGLQFTLVPSVGPDASLGLFAAEQRLRGTTSSLTEIVLADPAAPSRDRAYPITWWSGSSGGAIPPGVLMIAPGHQALVYTARRAGLSLGMAVIAVNLIAWSIGLAAWGAYFMTVSASRPAAWATLSAFALFRASHNSSYIYLGGETVLWAAVPVVALLNLAAMRAGSAALAPIAAGAAVMLVMLKPSAALLVAAIGLWWALESFRQRTSLVRVVAWGSGATLVWVSGYLAGALPIVPAAAVANANLCVPDPPAVVAWATGGWLMGLSDAAAAVESGGRAFSWLQGSAGVSALLWLPPRAAAAISVVLAVAFGGLWLSARQATGPDRERHAAARQLVVVVIVVVTVGIALLQMRGACVSFEGRHHQYGSFLALPFVVSLLIDRLSGGDRLSRRLAAAVAIVLVALPALYGAAALIDKALVRMPQRQSTVGADGLRRDWLPPGASAHDVDEAMREALGERMLAFSGPTPALAYVERRQLLAWTTPVPALPAEGVGLLLPRTFPSDVPLLTALLPVRNWEVRALAPDVRLLLSPGPIRADQIESSPP
jgi:hypothetical protein